MTTTKTTTEFGQQELRSFTFLQSGDARDKCKQHASKIELSLNKIQKSEDELKKFTGEKREFIKQKKLNIGQSALTLLEELEKCKKGSRPTKRQLFAALFGERKNRIDECIAMARAVELGAERDLHITVLTKIGQIAKSNPAEIEKLIKNDKVSTSDGPLTLMTASASDVVAAIKKIGAKKEENKDSFSQRDLNQIKNCGKRIRDSISISEEIISKGRKAFRNSDIDISSQIEGELQRQYEDANAYQESLEGFIPSISQRQEMDEE